MPLLPRSCNARYATYSAFLWRHRGRLVFLVVLIVSAIILGEFALETPASETLQMVPAVVATWIAAGTPPTRHACGPCGCDDVSRALAEAGACMGDVELTRLSALDVRPTAGGESDAAAALRARVEIGQLSSTACIDLAKSVVSGGGSETTPVRTILWHMYWKPETSRGFQAAHTGAIEAWLATQSDTAILIVWVPVPEAAPGALLPLARAFPGRVFVRALDVLWEAENSPIARSYLLRLTDKYSWVDSDMVRMVILYRYGGVYADVDVLLGRDASHLMSLEFVTEFSCGGGINGAIMRTFAHGPLATHMLEMAVATKPRLAMWTYGPWLLDRLRAEVSPSAGASLVKLPWCFFHGIWCDGAISRDALVGKADWSPSFFAGVFGVHMHGAGKLGGLIETASLLGTKMLENRAVLEARLRKAGKGSDDHYHPLPPLQVGLVPKSGGWFR